ncbi:MAG TPA: hypothetical protein VKM55_00580 [Candidatus Lokiarchaeia archaeon]|nr:hypothetical protein [Candidatus Lokiarchaeia archaeon]
MTAKKQNTPGAAQQQAKIGYIHEILQYECTIILDKQDEPKPIYPITKPVPVYVKDLDRNAYIIHSTSLLAPGADLPALEVVNAQGTSITLDPAKRFILESPLSTFQSAAVFITETAVPELLAEVSEMDDSEIEDTWRTYGFKHLKLVASALGKEKFKVFTREFANRFGATIRVDPVLRGDLLSILVNIGADMGLNTASDYLETVTVFMGEENTVLVLETKASNIPAMVKANAVRYGDIVCFEKDGKKTAAIVASIDLTASLYPVIEVEDGKDSTFVNPLKAGWEGSATGARDVVDDLFKKLDKNFTLIPLGKVPGTGNDYFVALKGNELIHFAIISLSGRGKGNTLKIVVFETMKMQVDYKASIGQDILDKDYKGPGLILFDDVGEYTNSLKPGDWGINIGALGLIARNDFVPEVTFVDICIDEAKDIPGVDDTNYIKLKPTPMKIPLEYIPMEEILRDMEGTRGAGLVRSYMSHYYGNNPIFRPDFDEARLSIEFINWFMQQEDPGNFTNSGRDNFGFMRDSFIAAESKLKSFLWANKKYIGLMYDRKTEEFHYLDKLQDKNQKTSEKLAGDFNLLKRIKDAAEKGYILIIDESNLEPDDKMLVQRIALHYLVDERQKVGFIPNIRPCLFIIEEATAQLRGQSWKQIELFTKVQVKARKFGIGIGLVLQDVNNIDSSLLTQLGWMVTLGLPVDSMRTLLFKNVPANLGPFDDFIKYSDVGVAVAFQDKIGRNLPLPVNINHYERRVHEVLHDNVSASEIKIAEDMMKLLKVPEEVQERLLDPHYLEKPKEEKTDE